MSKKIKLIKSVIKIEKAKIAIFLANNPEIVTSYLIEEMVFIGLPVFYVSLITGVSIEEINRLKDVRH